MNNTPPNDWKEGDTFYLKYKPKNFTHLYGKKLTVGIAWGGGDVTPIEEFCSIKSEYVTREIPILKLSLWQIIKNKL